MSKEVDITLISTFRFCRKCGAPLKAIQHVNGFDPVAGKPDYYYTVECTKRRWYAPHDHYYQHISNAQIPVRQKRISSTLPKKRKSSALEQALKSKL